MLFRRREAESLFARIRTAVWPRHSWSRSSRYFTKRVLRLSGSPHTVAIGVAAGVFTACTPFVGFHILISVVLAFAIGGNLLAAGMGTFIGNPLTFPVIWATTYSLGNQILGHHSHVTFHQLVHDLVDRSFEALLPILGPMTVGAIPLGLLVGAVFYVIAFFAVRAFRDLRRERLAARRRERRRQPAAAAEEPDPS
jgi:uncharacterized protein (DUF2062 family)